MEKALQDKLKSHAWKYGHFRNPAYPETHEVQEGELASLAIGDEALRQAVSSVQVSDCQCNDLCQIHHGRDLQLDGDPGPATLALLDIRRCQVPDFSTEDDEFGLAGTGGWLQCDPKRDYDHEVVIRFDDRNAPNKWKGYMEEVKANAVKISADIGLSVRYISPYGDRNYQSSVIFKLISGGIIGFYYLPQGAGCRRVPQGALDTSYQPDVQMASLLWIHEGLGHGIGLPHTTGGIMNPSIRRTPISWRNDPSWRTVERLYGGVPLDLEEPPLPPTNPIVTATVNIGGDQYELVQKHDDDNGGGGGWPF